MVHAVHAVPARGGAPNFNPNPNRNPNPNPNPNPHQESLQLWAALASSLEGVPLVKPIVEAKEGGLVDGLFQFKHLSFQEALSGQFLVQVAYPYPYPYPYP